MNADLVSRRDQRLLFLGINQRRYRRYVKGSAHVVARQQRGDARHADPGAILAPGQPPDGFAAVTQFIGLMVGIEG